MQDRNLQGKYLLFCFPDFSRNMVQKSKPSVVSQNVLGKQSCGFPHSYLNSTLGKLAIHGHILGIFLGLCSGATTFCLWGHMSKGTKPVFSICEASLRLLKVYRSFNKMSMVTYAQYSFRYTGLISYYSFSIHLLHTSLPYHILHSVSFSSNLTYTKLYGQILGCTS